jgi:hypothetical protein
MMTKTATPEMSREQHAQIIEAGIELDSKLFTPITLESILAIERRLQELNEQTGREYVAVPVGQPYGGPKKPIALPREDVEAAHRAYETALRGISPEIGRAYDLSAERERLENGKQAFNPAHYPQKFLDFLSSYSHK